MKEETRRAYAAEHRLTEARVRENLPMRLLLLDMGQLV